MLVDYHTHTDVSDGQLPLSALINRAKSRGLSLLVVSDHDTLGAFAPSRTTVAARYVDNGLVARDGLFFSPYTGSGDSELMVIPGIEFSTRYGDKELHISGLFMRPELVFDAESPIARYLGDVSKARWARAREMATNMGIDADHELSTSLGHTENPSRLHIARVLFDRELDHHSRDPSYRVPYEDAYQLMRDKLSRDAKTYVTIAPRHVLKTAEEIIDLILSLGGVPMWAHPNYPERHFDMETTMAIFFNRSEGHMLFEAHSGNYGFQETDERTKLAARHGWPIAWSSDFHGWPMKKQDLGIEVDKVNHDRLLERLLRSINQLRS